MTRFKATNLDQALLLAILTCFFQDCNLEGSPRHSLGSNNSSNLSTPPSPVREMGSSSYESWIVKEKFYVATDEANISRAEVFRKREKEGYLDKRWREGGAVQSETTSRDLCRCCRTVRLSYWNSIEPKFCARFNWICIHQILHSFSQPV